MTVFAIVKLVYIYDISIDIDSEISLFADDCVCYRENREADDSLKLQRDIDRLGCWARKWGMRFQPVKCNIITRKRTNVPEVYYTLEGTVLENVNFIKYIGVTITHDLRWNTLETKSLSVPPGCKRSSI